MMRPGGPSWQGRRPAGTGTMPFGLDGRRILPPSVPVPEIVSFGEAALRVQGRGLALQSVPVVAVRLPERFRGGLRCRRLGCGLAPQAHGLQGALHNRAISPARRIESTKINEPVRLRQVEGRPGVAGCSHAVSTKGMCIICSWPCAHASERIMHGCVPCPVFPRETFQGVRPGQPDPQDGWLQGAAMRTPRRVPPGESPEPGVAPSGMPVENCRLHPR